jgi:hypothetical protein
MHACSPRVLPLPAPPRVPSGLYQLIDVVFLLWVGFVLIWLVSFWWWEFKFQETAVEWSYGLLYSAITRSRRRGRQPIFVMQAAQHRSGAHSEALADPMAG